MATPPKSPGAESPRFSFVDALRGVAALWVAGFHFYGGLCGPSGGRTFAEPVHSFLRHGNSGVEIFFVISGFVVAYSIRNALVTRHYFGSFVLRRAVRLDPPYWCTIALACTVIVIANAIRSDRTQALPSLAQLAAHLVYLQNCLHMGNIVDVFWTLCIEVQFYVAFLLLTGLAQRLARRAGSEGGLVMVFGPLALWSVAIRLGLAASPHAGFMIKFWYLFQLGALAWWVLGSFVRPRYFWAYALLLFGAECESLNVESLTGVMTGLGVYLVGRAGRLETWLAYSPLQFFGRISYSLYLVHPIVGVPFTYYFARRWAGIEPSVPAALGLFLTAFAVSTVAAYLLHRIVECPSVELSRRLKTTSFRSALAGWLDGVRPTFRLTFQNLKMWSDHGHQLRR